jgi:hypothetical protein
VVVSFIGAGNRSIQRKPPIGRKSLTNFSKVGGAVFFAMVSLLNIDLLSDESSMLIFYLTTAFE